MGTSNQTSGTGRFRAKAFLVPAIVFVAVVAGSATVSATVLAADSTQPTVGTSVSAADSSLVARCTASPTEVNVGETVTLDASGSDANFVEFDRDGDGDYETLDETGFVESVSYSEAGTYEPQARDDEGNIDQCGTVVVNEPPSATFTFQPDPGVEAKPVEFDASNAVDTDGDIARYHWNWDGDGIIDETTTGPVVNHTYFSAGFENVALTVEDNDGANATTVRDVEIVEANVLARCSVDPAEAVVGQSVTVDASGSENDSFYSYEFGDGTGISETGEDVVFHTYEETGTYVPVVTVTGPGGKQDITECRPITVESANEPPVADFTFSPDPGVAGQSMTFDASASADPDGTVQRFEWDFDGDGSYEQTTTDPLINSTFSSTGGRNVGLRVVDDQNASATTARDVEVIEPRLNVRCTVEPASVEPGGEVAIQVEAPNASFVDYDFDGDGRYDLLETRRFQQEEVYEEPGEYVPVVRVYGAGEPAIEECGTVTVEPDNEPPEASFTHSPDPGIAGEAVTFDASASFDPDGTVQRYEWDFDGDGSYEQTTTDPLINSTLSSTGGRTVDLRVVDDDQATDETVRDVEIIEPRLNVRCTVEPATVEPGGEVAIQVEAPNASFLDYDFDGDGQYDRLEATAFTVTRTYNETGEYVPVVRVYSGLGGQEVGECTAVTVEGSDEGGVPLPPWWPIPVGGVGLLGLLYYFIGGVAGGGGGGGSDRHTPKPKPRPDRTQEGLRYETGVFEIPSSSGTLAVPVGFEPDLMLFSAVNSARTDTATDRTAGWSRGIASWTDEGIENQCLTVADDAHGTDQATCAVDDQLALQIVRHEADGPPGRVTIAVADTNSDGFDVDVSVPGDDPLAGGIRVLYQAVRTGPDASVEAGTAMTPTEPGTQTIDFEIEADYVSLATTAAVSDTDQLWTTDRGVGFSVGHAVAEPESPVVQAVAGTSAWPGAGHPTAGVADDTAALHLLYQDGDRLAGRTSARATALGETMRLQYDRVYNGPHKIGSTATHPISYLAVAGGDKLRPAVGTFELPRPGDTLAVDCGFEPAMIECQVAPAPLGEAVSAGAMSHPFGSAQGTAIATGDRLRQYVLHHSVVPGQPEGGTGESATVTSDMRASASTDGGRETGTDGNEVPADVTTGVAEPVDDDVEVTEPSDLSDPTDVRDTASVPAGDVTDVQPKDPETPAGSAVDEEEGTAPAPTEHADDGRIGLWLATASDGTILGRDELAIAGITETGFRVNVRSVDTDRRRSTGLRPTVVYRAWPAVDVTDRGQSSDAGDQRRSEENGESETPRDRGSHSDAVSGETFADPEVPDSPAEKGPGASSDTEGHR